PLAVLEVELASGVGAVEEAVDQLADRAVLEAVGLVPIGRGAGRLANGFEEPAVVRGDLELLGVALDDRRSDRQGIEQAAVVRSRKVRFRARVVPPPVPLGRR